MEVPWIPVTQALPEPGVKVLAICGHRPQDMTIKILHRTGEWWCADGVTRVSYGQDYVTHWLPIPEQPKG